MTREDIFRDLVSVVANSGQDIDVSRLVLDDSPFHVHGIDSMMLVRLIGAVEEKFGIAIEDSDALLAYSFERLVDLVIERTGANGSGAAEESGATSAARRDFLAEVEWHLARTGDVADLRCRRRGRDDDVVTYGRLLRVAAHLAGGVPQERPGRRTVVLVAAAEPLTTAVGFLTGLVADALPLVLPPPRSAGGTDAWLERVRSLAASFQGDAVVALGPGVVERSALEGIEVLPLPGDLADAAEADALPPRRHGGDDVAFLQMTSASTGDAKMVAITHRNIRSNLDGMVSRLELGSGNDRTCSWLPLHHDMGLIGGLLLSMYGGFPTVLMRPTDFIKDPGLWIRTIDEFRCTFTGAPNFAIDYAAMAVGEQALQNVDLSCVRRFGLAAEPIHRSAVQRFLDRFGPHGFDPSALVPGLGMAESTLSTTFRVDVAPRYLVVDVSGAVVGEQVRVLGAGVATYPAQPAPETPEGVAVFALGTPMADLQIELRDEEGRELTGDRVLGEIVVRGDSVTPGYWDAESATTRLLEGGILMSGDLGFVEGGDLFVLERRKNVIIRRGANHLASLLEQRAAGILGIPAHGVVVLEEDIHDPSSAVHLLIENAQDLPEPSTEQRQALRDGDLPIDVVTYARGFAIPRTTSGKKRYHMCRQGIVAGEMDTVQSFDLRSAPVHG